MLSAQDLRDPATAIYLLELRAALIVHEHAQNSADPDASANQRVSKAVAEAFIATEVRGMIDGLTALQEKDRVVVTKVFLLVSCYHCHFLGSSSTVRCSLHAQFLLTTVEGGLVDLLSFGVIQPLESGAVANDPTRAIRLTIKQLCEELLPEAIGLTDAFGFTDWELDR